MDAQGHQEPRIAAAAERQMQAWSRTAELKDREVRRRREAKPGVCRKNLLTISREAGSGGSEIARVVGEELGWEVLDKGLLDRVAERFAVSRTMLDLVDETPSNWVYDVLGTWMDRQIVPHEKYVSYLSRIVLGAARHGELVVVGRGAQFLLPRERTLAVRIVAPKKYRVEHIMRVKGIGEAAASHLIDETDEGRRELVDRFFHHDIADPCLYDLVINVGRCGPAAAVEQILAALGV